MNSPRLPSLSPLRSQDGGESYYTDSSWQWLRANRRVTPPRSLVGPRRLLSQRPAGPSSLTGRPGALQGKETETSSVPGRDARRVTAASGPRAAEREDAGAGQGPAGRPRAPPQHRLGWRRGTSGRAAPEPHARSAPSRKPETCQPHSPGYLRCAGRAQAGTGTSRERVSSGGCGPLNLSPGSRGTVAGARLRRGWGGGEAPCAPQGPMGWQQVACVGGA